MLTHDQLPSVHVGWCGIVPYCAASSTLCLHPPIDGRDRRCSYRTRPCESDQPSMVSNRCFARKPVFGHACNATSNGPSKRGPWPATIATEGLRACIGIAIVLTLWISLQPPLCAHAPPADASACPRGLCGSSHDVHRYRSEGLGAPTEWASQLDAPVTSGTYRGYATSEDEAQGGHHACSACSHS